MSGGHTSARSDRGHIVRDDDDVAGPDRSKEREAAWSPKPVIKRGRTWRDRPSTLVVVAVGLIAIAILKPWSIGAPPSASPDGALASAQSLAGPSAGSTASSQPVAIADPNAMLCLTHQTEQVLTLERWEDHEVKSWSPPTGASLGASDAGGTLTIASSHVVGIGVCPGTGPADGTPSLPNASPDARDPVAWSGAIVTGVQLLEAGGPRNLGAPPRITVQTDYVAAGVLYGAPLPPEGLSSAGASERPTPSGVLPVWPPGRYMISYHYPGDPARISRSVVLEIRTPLHDE